MSRLDMHDHPFSFFFFIILIIGFSFLFGAEMTSKFNKDMYAKIKPLLYNFFLGVNCDVCECVHV